jgi:hypothetical protein
MAKGLMGAKAGYFGEVIGVGFQKKERPGIGVIIGYLITDSYIRGRLEGLIRQMEGCGAKPAWFTTSHYKFKLNSEVAFQIKMGDGFKFRENEVHITVHTVRPQFMTRFKELVTADMAKSLTLNSAKFKMCNGCKGGKPCRNRSDFEYDGTRYAGICAANKEINFIIDSKTEDIDGIFQRIGNWVDAKLKFGEKEC